MNCWMRPLIKSTTTLYPKCPCGKSIFSPLQKTKEKRPHDYCSSPTATRQRLTTPHTNMKTFATPSTSYNAAKRKCQELGSWGLCSRMQICPEYKGSNNALIPFWRCKLPDRVLPECPRTAFCLCSVVRPPASSPDPNVACTSSVLSCDLSASRRSFSASYWACRT